MGLWLEQECARAWDLPFPDVHALAEAAPDDVPLFDPDDDGFLAPGDMPARIAAACARSGQREPRDRGETARAILVSLACKYRFVLERLEAVTGRTITSVHAIGGGVRNELLCRLTADVTGREVLVGAVEATALGNVLVQARAAGELGSLADMRAVAAASTAPHVPRPRPRPRPGRGDLPPVPRRDRTRHPHRCRLGDIRCPAHPTRSSPACAGW